MNVTHTDKFYKLKMEIMPESVLDQQSYVKEERGDEQYEVKNPIAVTTQHSNVDEVGTRLNTGGDRLESSSNANDDVRHGSLAENSVGEEVEIAPFESSKYYGADVAGQDKPPILMEENRIASQEPTEQDNTTQDEHVSDGDVVIEEEQKVLDEEEDENRDQLNTDMNFDHTDVHELTMSEHRKEHIYENFEARPQRTPNQMFPKVMQHKAYLPPGAPKRAKMYSVVTQPRSGKRSPIPQLYMKSNLAKKTSPSPQQIRDNNTIRQMARSLD